MDFGSFDDFEGQNDVVSYADLYTQNDNTEQIEFWLKKYTSALRGGRRGAIALPKYIIKDGMINVDGDIVIRTAPIVLNKDPRKMSQLEKEYYRKQTETYGVWHGNLPDYIKFNIVRGSFFCTDAGLTNLNGMPRKVYGAVFNVRDNKLKNLKGCPFIVKGFLDVSNNKLRSLKGAPKNVGGLKIRNNPIVKIMMEKMGFPKIADGKIPIDEAEHNQLLELI